MNAAIRTLILAAAVLGAVGALGLAQDGGDAETPAEDAVPKIAELAWLAGRWRGTATDGKTWETVYTTPAGGEILSASKEIRPDGSLAMFEYERFTTDAGIVKMVPMPFGKARTPFPLTSYDRAKRIAVFERPDNDFPRTITYARVDSGLRITLTGEMGGAPIDLTIDLGPAE